MNFFRELFAWQRPKYCQPGSTFCAWMIVFTLTCLSMAVIIDLLVSAILLSELQGFLAIDDVKTIWLAKSFFFMAAIAPLFSTHMATIYGFKKILFLGIFTFWFGAVMTGVASSYYEMLVYRTLAGTGGGIVLAVSLVYLTRVLPDAIQSRALTVYTNTFFGLGIAIGLLLGGYIGQEYHWRMAFLSNLYVAPVLTLLMLLLLPETDKIKKPPYDFFSLLTYTTAFLALLILVINAKAPWNTRGWHSHFIHGCAAISLFSFALFIWASLTKEHPLVNLRLFTRLSFSIGCLGFMIVGFMIFGPTLSSMDLFETIYRYQRSTLGLFVSSLGFIYFFFGIIPTVLANHLQPRIFISIGLALIILSCFMYQGITIQSSMFEIGVLQSIRSIGIAFVLGPFSVLVFSNLTAEEIPKASALVGSLRFMAATFGSSLITLIMEERTPYHALRFGEQVDIYSARFQQYFHEYKLHLIENTSASPAEAFQQARLLIIKYIHAQAQLASLNDALYIFGWITAGLMGVMAVMMLVRMWRRRGLAI